MGTVAQILTISFSQRGVSDFQLAIFDLPASKKPTPHQLPKPPGDKITRRRNGSAAEPPGRLSALPPLSLVLQREATRGVIYAP
jgi:hypothetical protein